MVAGVGWVRGAIPTRWPRPGHGRDAPPLSSNLGEIGCKVGSECPWWRSGGGVRDARPSQGRRYGSSAFLIAGVGRWRLRRGRFGRTARDHRTILKKDCHFDRSARRVRSGEIPPGAGAEPLSAARGRDFSTRGGAANRHDHAGPARTRALNVGTIARMPTAARDQGVTMLNGSPKVSSMPNSAASFNRLPSTAIAPDAAASRTVVSPSSTASSVARASVRVASASAG